MQWLLIALAERFGILTFDGACALVRRHCYRNVLRCPNLTITG